MLVKTVEEALSFWNGVIGINEADSKRDLHRYVDDEMVSWVKNIEKDPAKRKEFQKHMNRMNAIADQLDARGQHVSAEAYRNMAYLPEAQAWSLAKEFYQKERRNGVSSDVVYNSEGEEGSLIDSLPYSADVQADMYYGGSINRSAQGMFYNTAKMKYVNPESVVAANDLMDKLFKKLDSQSRLILIIRLFLGLAPGQRASKYGNTIHKGLTLDTIMKELPQEFHQLEAKLAELQKFGVKRNEVTLKMLVGDGYTKKNEKGTVIASVKPLLSQHAGFHAMERAKAAINQLAGTDGVNDTSDPQWHILYDTIVNRSPSRLFGESKELDASTLLDCICEAIATSVSKPNPVDTIMSYLMGHKVSMNDMIAAIVFAVSLNIHGNTPVSKTSMFRGSTMSIAKRYLNLAKSGGAANIATVQDMFMSPVLKANHLVK